MIKKKKYAMKRDFLDFGEYLKEKRTAAGFTQREISDALGYSSAQFISNFERGIALPPLNKLKLLVRIYKMPKADVVDRITKIKARLIDESL